VADCLVDRGERGLGGEPELDHLEANAGRQTFKTLPSNA
jgi:hypothetical protein